MERLTVDEIIEHCKRKTEKYEYLNGANKLENSDISLNFIKEYWEHRQVKEYLEELKKYEYAEEQGLLIRLPCKVGDTIYSIIPHDNFIMKSTVEEFVFSNMVYVIVRDELFNSRKGIPYCEKGKTWFLTKEEAEEALKNETDGK